MNSLTNERGEKDFMIKGGKICSVISMMPGYKDGNADITPKNRNGVIVVSLTPDVLKLKISVKEKLTGLPVRDASISFTGSDNVSQSLTTDDKGNLETTLPPASYTISSAAYPSINATVTGADADVRGTVVREFEIPREELTINVPITTDCFTSTVTVTNLKTGTKAQVRANAKGEVHLDLRLNGLYLIEHHGRVDTISTEGLTPDSQIDGPCKFHVGQTWVIRNIYYDFGKWTIRKDATAELDNLVRIMKENPTLQIELSSHTDCRASARFNMILSARRARAAVEYITKKGIKSRRILAAGYGESRLVNACHCEPKNDSNCNDPQHQDNRRTEVKVLHY
ncbi:MAG: OmpA family protein [Bacteroidetes bacterium]|nr:OmpA family protein [Bacteroidota bacterium]